MTTKTKDGKALPFRLARQALTEKSPTIDPAPFAASPAGCSESYPHWGDWVACKVLIAGFLILALMNLVNLVTSLFR